MNLVGTPFDLTGPLPRGRTLIEASAGTGKTYTISALVARYVAGELTGPGPDVDLADAISIDQLLVVTFTRSAASDLRERIRSKLRLAADHLDAAPADVPPQDDWLVALGDGSERVRRRRVARLRDALARFDEATITTIHGFCQQALTQAGLRSGTDRDVELVEDSTQLIAEVVRDLLVRELADAPLDLSSDSSGRPATDPKCSAPYEPEKVSRYLALTVAATLTNAGARHVPAPAAGGLAGRWAALVDEAVAAVEARQRDRRQIGYDRLVGDLARALADPQSGDALAAQLAARYPLVLVDEFQDTDRLQWDIFDRAFGGQRLIVVGDPKQAIYRFRGADVTAYLDAVRTADASTLAVNHRSDRRLLDGVALLFDGCTFGHPEISFRRVAAAPGAPLRALTERVHGGSSSRQNAPVHVRVVPVDAPVAQTSKGMAAAGARAVVLEDVASRVRSLLDHGTIDTGDTPARAVRPGDIAVLVPSQRRAADVASTLRRWGIPSVRSRTGSVLESDAALQWRLFVAGLASPTRARVARAAGLSWFFNRTPAELADDPTADGAAAESPLTVLQRELARHADRLRTEGFGALYEWFRADGHLFETVLERPYGDRNAADLDHVADLLSSALGGGPVEPFEVRQVLDRLMAVADRADDNAMRRIETDDQAVTITTIHAAKGLEYPIVLLPFAYVERPVLGRPYVFNEAGRVVDVASWVAWGDGVDDGSKEGTRAQEARKDLVRNELDGDSLRLLYVAMTRAMHRLELWWAPVHGIGAGAGARSSAFGRLLLDRVGAGPVNNSPVRKSFEGRDDAADQVDVLAAASKGAIAAFAVPHDHVAARPLDLSTSARRPLALAATGGRRPLADPAWRSWSFTALAGTIDHRSIGGTHALADGDGAPVVGGADETPAPLDAAVPLPPGGVPLADVAGGTTFGTMVHEVLEGLDFTSAALTADLAERLAAGAQRSGLTLDVDLIGSGLLAALDTPLGPLFGGRRLRQLAPPDRLAELEFDLRLGRGGGVTVPALAIAEAMVASSPVDDPFRRYFAELADGLDSVEIRGWLTGSIDAVFRVDGTFVVVDYKSNRLHTAGSVGPAVIEPYRPDHLVEAMTHSQYPLQAVLYAVALHRYLRWRLGDRYQPDVHLGGVAYLFVRGMVGPDTPQRAGESYGVFSWRPAIAAIESLDDLLRDGAPE